MMGGSELDTHTILTQDWVYCSCEYLYHHLDYTMQRPFFHFQNLGYQRNPFGALTDEEWAAIAVLPPAVERILADGFAHLQLLGPMGVGKSTTLLALQSWFTECQRKGAKRQRIFKETANSADKKVVYEYLPEGQRYFVTDTSELAVFLLDEAQRLNWRQRRRLVKMAGNACTEQSRSGRMQLIISSHEDLTPLFARRGLALTSVSLVGEMDVEWITAVLDKRLTHFAIPHQARAALTPAAVAYLHQTFGQNLRQMEYFLYEVWQQLESTEPVGVPFLQRVADY